MEQRWMDELERRLTPRRLYHSQCVAQQAKTLAEQWGGDAEQAHTAGMLHDIMKDTPLPEQLKIIEKSGILLNNVERRESKLLHAISGAAYLRDSLRLADEQVITAVRYHTTARAGMSLLEKILYIADFISADRDFEGVETLRNMLDQGLEATLLACVCFSLQELVGSHHPVHPDSLEAYNDCLFTQ